MEQNAAHQRFDSNNLAWDRIRAPIGNSPHQHRRLPTHKTRRQKTSKRGMTGLRCYYPDDTEDTTPDDTEDTTINQHRLIRHFPFGLSLAPIQTRIGVYTNLARPPVSSVCGFFVFLRIPSRSCRSVCRKKRPAGMFSNVNRWISADLLPEESRLPPFEPLKSRAPRSWAAGSPVARCDPESRRTSYVSPPPRPVERTRTWSVASPWHRS